MSKKFEDEMKSLRIDLDMIAPDNHRANGLAERQVRVLNDTMRQLSIIDKARWPSLLREIQVAIATTPSADTGISPYEMWTGYPMRRPDLKDADLPDDPPLDAAAPRAMSQWQRALAREQEEETAKEPRRRYNLRPRTFKVGNPVRVKLPEQRRATIDPATGQPRTYRKWVGAWASRLRVAEDLGRNQFKLHNPATRRDIKRSAQQMAPEGR